MQETLRLQREEQSTPSEGIPRFREFVTADSSKYGCERNLNGQASHGGNRSWTIKENAK